MADNRFAQVKEHFEKEPPKRQAQVRRKKEAAQKSPDSYHKKGVSPSHSTVMCAMIS